MEVPGHRARLFFGIAVSFFQQTMKKSTNIILKGDKPMQLTSKILQAGTGTADFPFRAHTKIQVAVAGCIWVAGLLIAGSDSPYMPWLNVAGAAVFSGAGLVLGKLLSRLDAPVSDSFSADCRPCCVADTPETREKMSCGIILPCGMGHQSRIFSNF
jgi:hypothetical protein